VFIAGVSWYLDLLKKFWASEGKKLLTNPGNPEIPTRISACVGPPREPVWYIAQPGRARSIPHIGVPVAPSVIVSSGLSRGSEVDPAPDLDTQRASPGSTMSNRTGVGS
jgi:hypothetical protein